MLSIISNHKTKVTSGSEKQRMLSGRSRWRKPDQLSDLSREFDLETHDWGKFELENTVGKKKYIEAQV